MFNSRREKSILFCAVLGHLILDKKIYFLLGNLKLRHAAYIFANFGQLRILERPLHSQTLDLK